LAPGSNYYDGPDLVEIVVEAIREAGLEPDRLDVAELAALDEFHALGRPATIALADLVGVRPGSSVLDVGAGIGGPARGLAARFGATVTALDPTERFCRLNEYLLGATGLAEQVQVVRGDALNLPFAAATYELAWVQALLQNIADKPRLVSEIARVLAPGGRLAMFEAVEGRGGPLRDFPVPWADDASGSFLVRAAALREIIVDAGLEILVWNEGPAAQAEIVAAAAELPPPPDNGLTLGLLMPDHEARMEGLARNIAEQRLELVQLVATKVGEPDAAQGA
jgi:SAM-dependent methyltransferase